MFLIIIDIEMALFNEGFILFIRSRFRVHMKSNVNKYYYMEGVLVHRLDFILDLKIIVFYKVNMWEDGVSRQGSHGQLTLIVSPSNYKVMFDKHL
jgi:hypothetical protein